MKSLLLVSLFLFSAFGCGSRSVLPDQKGVKVSREMPPSTCVELGKISGTSLSKTPTEQQALDDLKNEASHKGANYVLVQQYSATGGTVTGLAYDCP